VTFVDADKFPDVPVMTMADVPVEVEPEAVRVSTLDPVAGLVANVGVTPLGRLEAASVTPPLKPPAAVMETVVVVLPPCVTVTLEGFAASVKLGTSAGLTVSENPVEAVKLPDFPVMVTVEKPIAAVLPAVSVSKLEPVVGLVPKEAVTPLGKPEAAKVTLPLKPPAAVMEMVVLVLLPCVTVTLAGLANSVKLGIGFAFTVSEKVVEAFKLPEIPVMVTVTVPAAAELAAISETKLAPVVGFVPNDAVTPLGRPDAESVTPAPLEQLTLDTVIVFVTLPPCCTVILLDPAESEKFDVVPVPGPPNGD